MTRFVVDASVAVEYLLRTPVGMSVASTIESAALVAPELMDAEVLAVLRRSVLRGKLDKARAEIAIDDLCHWPVDRISNRTLAPLAWRYHRAVSAYDAFYVAAADAHGAALLTADGRLARASRLGVVLQHVHLG